MLWAFQGSAITVLPEMRRVGEHRRNCRAEKEDTTYLFVELDEGWLEELLDLSATKVVGELVVRQGHALVVLHGSRVQDWRLGDGVEGHRLVLSIPDLFEMHVGNLLVRNNCRVVRGSVTGEFGEVL